MWPNTDAPNCIFSQLPRSVKGVAPQCRRLWPGHHSTRRVGASLGILCSRLNRAPGLNNGARFARVFDKAMGAMYTLVTTLRVGGDWWYGKYGRSQAQGGRVA